MSCCSCVSVRIRSTRKPRRVQGFPRAYWAVRKCNDPPCFCRVQMNMCVIRTFPWLETNRSPHIVPWCPFLEIFCPLHFYTKKIYLSVHYLDECSMDVLLRGRLFLSCFKNLRHLLFFIISFLLILDFLSISFYNLKIPEMYLTLCLNKMTPSLLLL